MKWRKKLARFGEMNGLKVICVTPFCFVYYPGTKNLVDVGPREFLNLIMHAEVVFTDSFHGTAFSIIMRRPFYSMVRMNNSDDRKANLLTSYGLESRGLIDFEDIDSITDYQIDYSDSEIRRMENVEKGREYLKKVVRLGALNAGDGMVDINA